MKNVKVLGTGCANCKATVKLIEDIARAMNVAVNLEKIENISDIMSYGVMSTPGVVIDGRVVLYIVTSISPSSSSCLPSRR